MQVNRLQPTQQNYNQKNHPAFGMQVKLVRPLLFKRLYGNLDYYIKSLENTHPRALRLRISDAYKLVTGIKSDLKYLSSGIADFNNKNLKNDGLKLKIKKIVITQQNNKGQKSNVIDIMNNSDDNPIFDTNYLTYHLVSKKDTIEIPHSALRSPEAVANIIISNGKFK